MEVGAEEEEGWGAVTHIVLCTGLHESLEGVVLPAAGEAMAMEG